MAIEVFLMVLGAAFVHATWNALVKADSDRLALVKLMSQTQICVSFCLTPFVSVPTIDCWPFLLASCALNTGYMLLLNRAYQFGYLSLVYPFARGVAPFVVAGVSIVVLARRRFAREPRLLTESYSAEGAMRPTSSFTFTRNHGGTGVHCHARHGFANDHHRFLPATHLV